MVLNGIKLSLIVKTLLLVTKIWLLESKEEYKPSFKPVKSVTSQLLSVKAEAGVVVSG